MNRDIKLRVWSEKNKKMLEIQKHSFKTGLSMPYGSNMELYFGNLMRYTGLKDKNGKEIYEKDIVKVTINNKTFNAWIVFEMGSFMIANDDITYYIDDNWNDNVKCLSELAWEQEEFEDRIYCLEVIGDTYQNIDLIEV